jgi:hypothetical protein
VVGADHADEGQAREVVALREHLRADEDVDAFGRDLLAHRLERAANARRVAVDAGDAGVRKRLGERRLDPLRAETARVQVDVAARRARARDALGVAAVVAAQARRLAVHDQPRAAARAPGLPGAGRALERGRVAAPVDEHERLLAAREPRAREAAGRARLHLARALPHAHAMRPPTTSRAIGW